MARPLRIEVAEAVYHVTARGDRRESIFEDDADRNTLLSIVAQGLDRYDAVALAYCLMGNHYHFVLQTRQANLSRLMRHVNGVYTQTYNRRHRKVGHLLQGRFKAQLVDRDEYLLEVCRYVDLNPVRAGMKRHPRDWAWSSYRAHSGEVEGPVWLDSASLHRQLAPRTSRRDGPAAYARFVAEGKGVRLWDDALRGQIYLGSEAFADRMRQLADAKESTEVPRAQRRRAPQPIGWYFEKHDRNAAIVAAYLEGGYTQTAIAAHTALSVSRISRLIAATENRGKS